ITAYKEEKTIGALIESAINALSEGEIMIIAPDDATLNVAKSYINKHPHLTVLKDDNKGKPAALNLAIKKAKGNIVIFTDGDVILSTDSIKELANSLKPQTIATGKPTIIGDQQSMLNWWGKTLFDIVNNIRR